MPNIEAIPYTVEKSLRAKRVSIVVYPGGKVVLKMPQRRQGRLLQKFYEKRAHDFLREKTDWLRSKVAQMEHRQPTVALGGGRKHYLKYKEQARLHLIDRVGHFERAYADQWGIAGKIVKVNIRSQTSRWGSCSVKGNINFNYRLLFLPPHLRDYVVVHELCHLKEHNHSKRFWDLVALASPDYKQCRKDLKRYSF